MHRVVLIMSYSVQLYESSFDCPNHGTSKMSRCTKTACGWSWIPMWLTMTWTLNFDLHRAFDQQLLNPPAITHWLFLLPLTISISIDCSWPHCLPFGPFCWAWQSTFAPVFFWLQCSVCHVHWHQILGLIFCTTHLQTGCKPNMKYKMTILGCHHVCFEISQSRRVRPGVCFSVIICWHKSESSVALWSPRMGLPGGAHSAWGGWNRAFARNNRKLHVLGISRKIVESQWNCLTLIRIYHTLPTPPPLPIIPWGLVWGAHVRDMVSFPFHPSLLFKILPSHSDRIKQSCFIQLDLHHHACHLILYA